MVDRKVRYPWYFHTESSYPVLLSRTRRTFTMSAKSGICMSHTYAATIKISDQLFRSFNACVHRISRCCLHLLSLPPQAHGLSSDDLPYYRRWCNEPWRNTSKSAGFCSNHEVGDELWSPHSCVTAAFLDSCSERSLMTR